MKGTKTAGKRTLCVDIGGSGIKAIVLDDRGKPISERNRVETPRPSLPRAVFKAIARLAKEQSAFDRVSVGFPGVVRDGTVHTAVNLDPAWVGVRCAKELEKRLGRPVRVANDADIQGYGVIAGRGVEMVLTLGTGLGTALFVDGTLVPNLELGHHVCRCGKGKETYEENLGSSARDKLGHKEWQKRLRASLADLSYVFNFEHLYLGGGNAKKIDLKLPENVSIVPNVAGLLGGIALWRAVDRSR
jgi:polyphosphate glucokinase